MKIFCVSFAPFLFFPDMNDLENHFDVIDNQLELLVQHAHAHPAWISLERVKESLQLLKQDCLKLGFVEQTNNDT